jgi:hypothetical protein
MTVEELYEKVVRPLPEHEQVRLASFIMWKCGHGGRLDYSDEWSDEDMRDLTAHSLSVIDERLGETRDEPGATVTR